MVSVATIAAVLAIAAPLASDLVSTTRERKLDTDLNTLNQAVSAYLMSGGDLSEASSVEEVMAKLKTTRGNASSYAGLTGSMIDTRLRPIREEQGRLPKGRSHVVWDAKHLRFRKADGAKPFDIGAKTRPPGETAGKESDGANRPADSGSQEKAHSGEGAISAAPESAQRPQQGGNESQGGTVVIGFALDGEAHGGGAEGESRHLPLELNRDNGWIWDHTQRSPLDKSTPTMVTMTPADATPATPAVLPPAARPTPVAPPPPAPVPPPLASIITPPTASVESPPPPSAAPNLPPSAQGETFTLPEDGRLSGVSLLANDSDPDRDPLQLAGYSGGDHGTLTVLPDGGVDYRPAPDFHGRDAISYTVSDGRGGSATARATLVITPVNDFPAAHDDRFTAIAGEEILLDVLANDSDVDGDALRITAASTGHGTATLPSGTRIAYRSPSGFSGNALVRYTISDGQGGSATATATVLVTPRNRPPVAVADTYRIPSGQPYTSRAGVDDLTLNDSDPDGDSLTVETTPLRQPGKGRVTLQADGTFTYTPSLLATGADSFQYRISDGRGGTAVGTANLTIHLLSLSSMAVGWWQDGRPVRSGNNYLDYDAAVFSSATTLSAGPGVGVTEMMDGANSVFRITGASTSSVGTAQAAEDYLKATLVVRPNVHNAVIDGFRLYRFGQSSAGTAMAIYDPVTRVETLLFSRGSTSTGMQVSFSPYPLQGGRAYEVRLYVYNAPNAVSLDNPQLTLQMLR